MCPKYHTGMIGKFHKGAVVCLREDGKDGHILGPGHVEKFWLNEQTGDVMIAVNFVNPKEPGFLGIHNPMDLYIP